MKARFSRYLIGSGSAALAIGLGALPVIAMTAPAHATNAKGSLTVHALGTAIVDENNEPHVCTFTLVADNYASTITSISYTILKQAPTQPVNEVVASGTINLAAGPDGDNEGESAVISIDAGHYKPHGQWVDAQTGENGADNFKAFWVDCTQPAPSPSPSVQPSSPAPSVEPSSPAPSVEPSSPAPSVEPSSPAPSVEPSSPAPSEEPSPLPPVTGGGGGPIINPPAVTPPVTGGGGTPTTLPRTGLYTGQLAGWALAAIVAGLGMIFAGVRAPKHARR
jgi:hypothetical protein